MPGNDSASTNTPGWSWVVTEARNPNVPYPAPLASPILNAA